MKKSKKFIGMFLVIVLCVSISAPALAAPGSNLVGESSFALGDILYIETRTSTGEYSLTATEDGAPIDRVTMQIGQDVFYYETFNNDSSVRFPTNGVNIQVMYCSDFITRNSSNVVSRASSYAPKTGALGTVTYSHLDASGYVQRKLKFTSALQNSVPGRFDVSGSAGDSMTVLISMIVAGFGHGISSGLGAVILAGAGAIGGNVLDAAFTSTINGKCYLYNVTAKSADTSDPRSSVHGGEVYAGSMKVNDVWRDKVIYESHYPEFINQRDHTVAGWFFNDFWDGVFSVTSWS